MMEHNGDIKKIIYLIEQGLTESFEEDDSVKPFLVDELNIIKEIKDVKYKIDSYNDIDGTVDFRKGLLSGLQFSSELLEHLINRLEDNE